MSSPSPRLRTIHELLEWCRSAPAGARLDAHALADILSEILADDPLDHGDSPKAPNDVTQSWTWREWLWAVPAETRLGVSELAEAVGRPKGWVYARTKKSPRRKASSGDTRGDQRIPHRKLDGTLVFLAGEVRAWLRDRETVVVDYWTETPWFLKKEP
jgi:hypothetical protein